ncbi:MAG TPA: hypothetical protein VEU73_05955 [Gemmatimonadales bacterium]|nr:hypothetical protein [Gemmatimonadales bacterium]
MRSRHRVQRVGQAAHHAAAAIGDHDVDDPTPYERARAREARRIERAAGVELVENRGVPRGAGGRLQIRAGDLKDVPCPHPSPPRNGQRVGLAPQQRGAGEHGETQAELQRRHDHAKRVGARTGEHRTTRKRDWERRADWNTGERGKDRHDTDRGCA